MIVCPVTGKLPVICCPPRNQPLHLLVRVRVRVRFTVEGNLSGPIFLVPFVQSIFLIKIIQMKSVKNSFFLTCQHCATPDVMIVKSLNIQKTNLHRWLCFAPVSSCNFQPVTIYISCCSHTK